MLDAWAKVSTLNPFKLYGGHFIIEKKPTDIQHSLLIKISYYILEATWMRDPNDTISAILKARMVKIYILASELNKRTQILYPLTLHIHI